MTVRRLWQSVVVVGLLGGLICVAGCEDVGTTALDTQSTDKDTALPGTDAVASDVGEWVDLTLPDVAPECPGATGCACLENAECNSSLCLETQTTQQCAQTCTDNCPEGFACRVLSTAAADVLTICVPRWGRLCDPCTASKDCESPGLSGATCVAYGDNGNFCGSACQSNSDCPTGWGCQASSSVEGNLSLQCKRLPEAGQPATTAVCPCSLRASTKGLQTTCSSPVSNAGGQTIGKCLGIRQCTLDGLSTCSAKPTEEVCNGLDDDCDGATDDLACDDGKPCTQDSCDGKGKCSYLALAGQPCNADDSACTEGDSCSADLCVSGQAKVCNDNNPCTLDGCDAVKGCTQTSDDGKPCDDGISCTIGDTCKDSGCKGGQSISCPSKGPCESATCDGMLGKCVSQFSPQGSPCDDGSSCTVDDKCTALGDCQGGPKPCSDGNPCTNDACDPTLGCVSTPFAGPCDDGQPCTINDVCEAGSCKGGEDACKCQVDSDCKVLDDNDLCTGTLICDKTTAPFQCKVDPATLPKCPKPGSTCQAASCEPSTGLCQLISTDEGKACDSDGSVCTVGDKCLGGLCKIGAPLSCDDSNVCTADSCDPSAGCLHKPIAGSCNDGNACTDNDLCNAGTCAGSVKVCDDANPCSINACDPQAGCQYPDEADKTFCSADTKYWCEAGQCVVKILCGNGTIDAETNETCDDSNKTSWDGCSDKCISECWSLDLDGKKDLVTLPALNNDPAADQVTVELWLRFVIAPLGPATILSSDCMDLTWDGQVLRVETFAGCTGTGSGVTVDVPVGDAPTSWTHLAVQADNAGAVQVFVAGQPKAGPAVTPVPVVAGVHGTAIGARVVGGSGLTQFAPIRAMELRASKGWRYSGAFSPDYRFEPDLQTTALYHVLEGVGTAVAPATSGQNGLVTGAVWLQDAPQCPAPAPCGNLQLDRAEVCDDGGIAKGDGCSASCHLEPVPSCKHIGYLFPYLKTGLYQIDPDGFDGPVEPETLWCELENNSPNNWTLVGNFYDSAGDDMPNETKYVVSGWNQDGLGVGNVQKFSTGLAKPLDRVNTAQGSGAVSLAFIEAMAKVAGVKHLRMCFVGTDGKDTYCRASNNPNASMDLTTAAAVVNAKLKPFQSTALAYTFGRLAGLAASADGYDASLYSLGGFCIKRANAAEDVNSEPNFGKQSEGLCEHHNTTQGAWAGIWHGFGYGMSFKPWEKDDTELAAGTVSDGVNGLPIRANPSDKTWGFRLYVGGNVCGNGEEELGEACDDGNTKDGDTCPGNCGP